MLAGSARRADRTPRTGVPAKEPSKKLICAFRSRDLTLGGGGAIIGGKYSLLQLIIMKTRIFLLVIFFACGFIRANESRVSSKEPIVVMTPDNWKAAKDASPTSAFPFETYNVTPPANRNAVCLVTVFDKDRKEFTDPQFLKKLLKGDSRPYLNSPDDFSKIAIKEVKTNEVFGYYANFVDPDLVGKPVEKGSYKTATPIILCLNSKYLIKVTILCDEINGDDYRDAMKIVQSIKIKKE